MQNVTLSISVKTNLTITPEKISEAIRYLIDSGLQNAAEVLEYGEDGNAESAEIATSLHISAPVVAKMPRVLVVVSGGVADPVYDDGVDVQVFDWDNYNDEDNSEDLSLPAHFADLATPLDIPVSKN